MNVSTTVVKPEPVLVDPLGLKPGTVYSWGVKAISYVRVLGGSVCLHSWDFIPDSTQHFHPGAKVEVAAKADLTIKYETV